jgi:hypothetical protein
MATFLPTPAQRRLARAQLADDLVRLLPRYGFKTARSQADLAGMRPQHWHEVLRGTRNIPRISWQRILDGALGPISPRTPEEQVFRQQQQRTYDKYEATVEPRKRSDGDASRPDGTMIIREALLAAKRSQDLAEIHWLVGEALGVLDRL